MKIKVFCFGEKPSNLMKYKKENQTNQLMKNFLIQIGL